MSYFEQRIINELGITPEKNTVRLKCEGRFGFCSEYDAPIYKEDENGNIEIYFATLDRWRVRYAHPKADDLHPNRYNNIQVDYKITRLAPENVSGDMKYKFPIGAPSTYPFIPPLLLDLYEKREEIKTLYLTEGAFKAHYASLHGLPIVGLTSIQHYADKRTQTIHKDIATLIHDCKVKNVVMLYDADCLNISTKAIENGEDLAKRPNGFLNSMLKIKDLLEDYNVNIYFAHILNDVKDHAKGLDDLLIAEKGNEQAIINSALALSAPSPYFYRLNVSSFAKKLQGYFSLKSVTDFVSRWGDILQNRPFVFFGTTYQINEKGEVVKLIPKELKNFMRVGDDFFELVEVPNIFEPTESETVMFARNKGTITDDYGKDAIKNIEKFKAFINYPSNTNYQRVINGCYNTYNPIKHEPKEGFFGHTENFLKHYFGEQYELGLDYLTIIYRHPTETLPILCLVSEERGTGKSTFCNWLRDIYGNNVAYIGNTEFESQFNGAFTSKLITCIDETSFDNKRTTEKLKMLSTAKKINSQRKGKDFEEVNNFAKYILCSNNETNFIYTDENEVRFWIRKLNKLEVDNPNLPKLLHSEIPAFLHFLGSRRITHPKKTRAWFEFSLLRTEALEQMFNAQKPTAQKIIEKYLTEMFDDFNLTEIVLSERDIYERCPQLKKYESKLRDIILKKIKADITRNKTNGKPSPQRYKIPYFMANGEVEYTCNFGRAFVFRREMFFK